MLATGLKWKWPFNSNSGQIWENSKIHLVVKCQMPMIWAWVWLTMHPLTFSLRTKSLLISSTDVSGGGIDTDLRRTNSHVSGVVMRILSSKGFHFPFHHSCLWDWALNCGWLTMHPLKFSLERNYSWFRWLTSAAVASIPTTYHIYIKLLILKYLKLAPSYWYMFVRYDKILHADNVRLALFHFR